MEPIDLFRKTLILFLKIKGRGSQKKLSEKAGVASSLLNDFLKGRKVISESKRNDIAAAFDFAFEEFLALGRRLLESDEPYFWMLRAVYISSPIIFADLAKYIGINISELELTLKKNFGYKFPANYLEKTCSFLSLSADEFKEEGQYLIIENPRMKWSLGEPAINEIIEITSVSPKEEQKKQLDIDPIVLEHMELVKQFRHKEQAKKINENLLVIDQNPEAMRKVEAYIEGLADGIRLSMGTAETTRPNQQDRQAGKLKNGTED